MGTVRKRSDGRWEGRYTGPDGGQHSVYGKTEAECTKALRAAQREVDMGVWREPSKMTMSEWLDIWLRDYQTHTSKRTVVKYKCVVENHFKPSAGKVKVAKLSQLHVRHLIADMQAKGRAASTIQTYMHIFNAAMNCAVEAGLIAANPCAKVKVQRGQPKQFCVVDRAEIPTFLGEIRGKPFEYELTVMLLTGLRLGELRGLKWEDIDFDAGTVNVRRQLHPNVKGQQPFSLPKYGETRLLHVAPEVISALRAQKRKQAEQRIAAGADWQESEISKDLVFRQENGMERNERTLYRAVKAVGSAIGKPDLSPHDLRHSYAVAALRSGANVKTVQYNLGHKTAEMTLDVYAAYTDDSGKTDAGKLSEYLRQISN
jgi:integrase